MGKGTQLSLGTRQQKQYPSRTCELTWRSSWHETKSRIGVDIIKAWEHATHKEPRQLTLVLYPLPPDPYTQYGAILCHLKLRDLILHPISAMQARVGVDEEGQPEVPAWKVWIPYSPIRSASHRG